MNRTVLSYSNPKTVNYIIRQLAISAPAGSDSWLFCQCSWLFDQTVGCLVKQLAVSFLLITYSRLFGHPVDYFFSIVDYTPCPHFKWQININSYNYSRLPSSPLLNYSRLCILESLNSQNLSVSFRNTTEPVDTSFLPQPNLSMSFRNPSLRSAVLLWNRTAASSDFRTPSFLSSPSRCWAHYSHGLAWFLPKSAEFGDPSLLPCAFLFRAASRHPVFGSQLPCYAA